jgi:hypothetical protein
MNFTDYFFDTPWWLPACLAVTGAVLFYVANNRQEVRLRTVGLAILCVAVLLAGVSYFVDTDREKAEDRSRAIVRAVHDKDWPALRSLLEKNTTVGILNGPTVYRGGEQIAARAQDATEKYGVQSVTVTSLDSRQDQTLITVTVSVLSTQAVVPTITSRWEFDYLQSADGWYLNEIRAVQIGRQEGEGMESMFPRRSP